LSNFKDAEHAIAQMVVRGAPLIGATAAYGVALAMSADNSNRALTQAIELLRRTRPTAINLNWALNKMSVALIDLEPGQRRSHAFALAGAICDEDAAVCRKIGEFDWILSTHNGKRQAVKRTA
jgi:methylthioribose-1-phosphate isomerase